MDSLLKLLLLGCLAPPACLQQRGGGERGVSGGDTCVSGGEEGV